MAEAYVYTVSGESSMECVDTPMQPIKENEAKERKRTKNKAWYAVNAERLKASRKVYRKNNSDRIKAYNQAYYAANPDHQKAQNTACRQKNLERSNACQNVYKRAWRERNNERLQAYKKAYNCKNADRIKARGKKYRDKNTERIQASKKTYRQQKLGCVECKSWPDWRQGWPHFDGHCFRCFSKKFPTHEKVKSKARVELLVRAFIDSNFPEFVHDKPMHTRHCDYTVRWCVDHRKTIGNTLICIETDTS
jgi:hypothetical protein